MRSAAFILVLTIAALSGCSKDKGTNDDPPCNYEPSVRYHQSPDWSPDGRVLMFEGALSLENAEPGLYFFDFEDSSTTLFLAGLFLNARFSPDGQWLAFSHARNIYRVAITQDSAEQLTFSTDNFFPDWSPDGNKIAYDVSAGDDRGVYILNLSTRQAKKIYPYARHPVWFPDCEHLAVNSFNFQSGPELAVIDTTGNLIKRLTDNDSYKRGLDVSPDGAQICFTQDFRCEMPQLWIMNRDGTGLMRLTERGGDMPAFSPDGEWIAYTYLGDGNGCIWIMRPDGSEKRQLTFMQEDE